LLYCSYFVDKNANIGVYFYLVEKSKHLGLIGVFVQQNYSQTNTPRVQASGNHSFIHSDRNLRSEYSIKQA